MRIITIVFLLLSFPAMAKEQTLTLSELQTIYDKLNISTFRSSLMPKRTKDQLYLSQTELPAPEYFSNGFSIDNKDWIYTFSVIEKKDKNRDGVVDYTICFSDKSKMGTYYSVQPMLISPLGIDGQFIALSFTVDGC
ncbi:hypothetical protein Q0A17_12695 [Citrobacter sp. S2-9]|uniref:Pesticin immunity protein n=1 Tax=Citrobacter enshiensis TaxID=2971264 RepID=A0ABT8PV82_9ENTR|nr:hypothetical protein [Citrobacter enshiensis]MDN8600265.1 hypothetical protein [Citrobacter enshiensis]